MDNKKMPRFNLGDVFYINQAVPSLNDSLRMICFQGDYRVTKIDNEPDEESIFYHLTQACGGHTICVIEDILEKSEKKE